MRFSRRLAAVLLAAPLAVPMAMAHPAKAPSTVDRVTITRDEWGIAHVSGQTDADAVYGMIYAQAEDDFPRIERNYLVNLGRLSEAEGKARSGRICASACSSTPTGSRRTMRKARSGCAS
jgi:acyl-homoserine-lactone acylase